MVEPESEDQPKPVNPQALNKYEMLDYLLKFIDTDTEANPILAGYFAKILLTLMSSKQDDFTEYIYCVNKNVLSNLT